MYRFIPVFCQKDSEVKEMSAAFTEHLTKLESKVINELIEDVNYLSLINFLMVLS